MLVFGVFRSVRILTVSAFLTIGFGALVGETTRSSFAATQGTIGATSDGALNITLTIAILARVSGIDDIDLGTWSGSGDLAISDDICVWASGGGYSITASGDGAGGAFTLGSGDNTVEYSVKWADGGGSESGTALSSNAALEGQTSTATSSDCDGGNDPSATVAVEIAENQLAGAAGGSYSGTITLVVAPE
jgi:hypothetical protein